MKRQITEIVERFPEAIVEDGEELCPAGHEEIVLQVVEGSVYAIRNLARQFYDEKLGTVEIIVRRSGAELYRIAPIAASK